MAKRTKKNDPQQKNKQGFDSAVLNEEFAHESGSANANRLQKEISKRQKGFKTRNMEH